MSNFIGKNNLGIVCCKQLISENFTHAFLTSKLMDDSYLSNRSRERSYCFPLYNYKNEEGLDFADNDSNLNLNMEIVDEISKRLSLLFNKTDVENSYASLDLIDYIYAALHSPKYRSKYISFLKKDFPRIPYPNDTRQFWEMAKLGKELRHIHLLETDNVEKYITSYPIDGDNILTRKIVKKDWELYDGKNQLGRIWINEHQYFDKIPLLAWEFYIGCYQPAKKWLKDRVGRTLNFNDILHYQKIIVSLVETDRIMQEIDKIDFA